MRIGISLLDFQPRNSGGIESYVHDLIQGLQDLNIHDDFFIIMNWHNNGEVVIKSHRFKTIYADHRLLHQKILNKAGIKGNSGKDQILRVVEGLNLDVILYPLQHIPLGLEDYKGKFVVSIMDIQHEYLKEFFGKQEYLDRNKQYREACNKSTKIISISNFTKRTLVEKYKISPNKISTVYLNFNPSRVSTRKQKVSYGKYFFYPAATWPHKNHIRLIKAFGKLNIRYPEYKLVLAGIKKQKEDDIEEEIRILGLKDSVIRLGYVDDDRLAGLFTNAFALVFPSLFEGFGIPVLEAMSIGVPTTISNTTSLPEVGGNATLYFDPKKIGDIEDKMAKLIMGINLRTKLVTRGHKQVKKFSLDKMANQTYQLLREVVHG